MFPWGQFLFLIYFFQLGTDPETFDWRCLCSYCDHCSAVSRKELNGWHYAKHTWTLTCSHDNLKVLFNFVAALMKAKFTYGLLRGWEMFTKCFVHGSSFRKIHKRYDLEKNLFCCFQATAKSHTQTKGSILFFVFFIQFHASHH